MNSSCPLGPEIPVRWQGTIKLAKALFRIGVYVFYLLLGGVLFAYLSQFICFIGSLVFKKFDASAVQHVAWVIGVIFFAIGRPMGWVKVAWFRGGSETPYLDSKAGGNPPTQVKGVLGNAGFFALIGLILGIVISTVLVMSWFSISVSPFAPAGWSESVHAATSDSMQFSDDAGGGFESSHPMLLRLFWMPLAICAGIGLVTGAIIGVVEKLTKKTFA